MARITFKRKLWIWPTQSAAWHFIYIDGKEMDRLVRTAKTHHMGMIKVRATVRKTVWETSIFPNRKEKCYLLPIKKSIRQKEDLFDGEMITVKLESI
jgi:hypothetical protein